MNGHNTLKINFVDAFTDSVFKGNPAAVVITEKWLDDSVMQSIATENNLSETAFAVKNAEGIYHLRWFSPLKEIAFCGHATLASAFILFKENSELDSVTFFAEAVGNLTVRKGDNGYITMDFPARPPTPVEDIPPALYEGLSQRPTAVYQNTQAYIAVFENEEDVFNIQSQSEVLKHLAPHDVMVTAPGEHYDFVSRYFWPANGGDEDPVTGSAHTGLTPLWANKLNKTQLSAYQASARGGALLCELTNGRVIISGKAAHYLEGTIHIPI